MLYYILKKLRYNMKRVKKYLCFLKKKKTKCCILNQKLEKKKLEIPLDIKLKDVPKFVPTIKKGRVLKVYDGDTITIVGYEEGSDELHKYSIRINGIDCPELKSKNKNEVHIAKIARDMLALMIYKNIVSLENVKGLDKYGRLLCDVIYDDINVSKWMLEKRLAVEYDGGKKNSPECWLEYYNGK